MAGYDLDFGMSNNAIDAYSNGVRPLSRWTVELLREGGWKETRTLAMYLAKSGFWPSFEWHHSGGTWFNEVKFYDVEYLVERWDDLTEAERDERRGAAKCKPKAEEGRKVSGHFTIWGGSRRRPTKMGQQEFTGILRGGWIHLDGGGRKKASGNHIQWRYSEERTWMEWVQELTHERAFEEKKKKVAEAIASGATVDEMSRFNNGFFRPTLIAMGHDLTED
jgi:hypothetical protein